MKEYVPQLRIGANDPLCTASSLEGTVIGVLFEKTGAEIKKAIEVRLGLITVKVTQYRDVITKIEGFIEKKRTILRDLDHLYEDRMNEKRALIRPFQRQIEDTLKQCQDSTYNYDRDTIKQMGEKAVVFEDGFDEASPLFSEIDQLFKKEEGTILGVQGVQGYSGPQGVTGIQGATGCQGLQGSRADSSSVYSAKYLQKSNDLKSVSEHITASTITEEEDMAAEKLRTLRYLLQKYVDKLSTLDRACKGMQEEKRRLTLIRNNILDDRSYKLDLNKLSGFGFEDISVG